MDTLHSSDIPVDESPAPLVAGVHSAIQGAPRTPMWPPGVLPGGWVQKPLLRPLSAQTIQLTTAQTATVRARFAAMQSAITLMSALPECVALPAMVDPPAEEEGELSMDDILPEEEPRRPYVPRMVTKAQIDFENKRRAAQIGVRLKNKAHSTRDKLGRAGVLWPSHGRNPPGRFTGAGQS